jgi:hypothetical protein
MKNYFLILIICLFTYSCAKRDNCNNNLPVVGSYENIYDKEAKNVLILREDSTFEQIFTKGRTVKRNKGSYRFFRNSCSIYFKNLKVFQNLPKLKEEYHIEEEYPAKFRNNNVIFLEDFPDEFDYYRIYE